MLQSLYSSNCNFRVTFIVVTFYLFICNKLYLPVFISPSISPLSSLSVFLHVSLPPLPLSLFLVSSDRYFRLTSVQDHWMHRYVTVLCKCGCRVLLRRIYGPLKMKIIIYWILGCIYLRHRLRFCFYVKSKWCAWVSHVRTINIRKY